MRTRPAAPAVRGPGRAALPRSLPHCPLGDHHISRQALKGLPGTCVPGVYSQHGPVVAQCTLLIARCP